ncbi:hypothetical protein ACFLRC_01770 [Candidatus Altiarchaeota archaeon]
MRRWPIMCLIGLVLASGCISSITKPESEDCVSLGYGPNVTLPLGQHYGSKDKICCEGLVLRGTINSYKADCGMLDGGGNLCIACGDGTCDSTYENYCNCPEDCE